MLRALTPILALPSPQGHAEGSPGRTPEVLRLQRAVGQIHEVVVGVSVEEQQDFLSHCRQITPAKTTLMT